MRCDHEGQRMTVKAGNTCTGKDLACDSLLDDCYLSKKESARYTGLSADTLDYHSLVIGDLPRIKLEGKVLYKRSVLDRWLESYGENLATFDPEKLADKALSKLRKKLQRAG